MNTKQCPKCGAELDANAAFCPHCTATLTERRRISMPRGHKRWQQLLMAIIGVAALAAALIAGLTRPAVETGGDADPSAVCQTYYTGEDGREYHVFTAQTPAEARSTVPVGYYASLVEQGGTQDFPATVIVQDAVTQNFAAEDFSALLESWDVTVIAAEGTGRAKLWEAEDEAADSPALLYRRLRADDTCTHSEIVWTLRMKNGDVLTLTQVIELKLQEERYYDWQDTPMDTAEELQTLLDTIAAECDAETLVTIRLPEVTYDQPITIACSATLLGSGTVFAAPVHVAAQQDTELAYAYVRFASCSFNGDGTGTGLTVAAPTYFEQSSISGWEIGAEAVDGGWVYLREGRIGECGVGMRYNSALSSTYTYDVRKIDFVNNDTALEIVKTPRNVWMNLQDCVFTGNGTDISNPAAIRVEGASA